MKAARFGSLTIALIFCTLAQASAEVIITRSGTRATYPAPSKDKDTVGVFGKGPAATSVRLIPFFVVDDVPGRRTTLLSVRNEAEDGTTVNATVEYRGVDFYTIQVAQNIAMVANQVRTFNVEDIQGLAVDPDGFKRGAIQILADGPISSDSFQVDRTENFATGGLAFSFPEEFCTDWTVRFLNFGGPQDNSLLSFLVNGPQGGGGEDPPTIIGEIFNELGDFVNDFEIRTSNVVFQVDVRDLVEGNTFFGAIELSINSNSNPSGLVFVEHSAQGRFSIGAKAVCKDPLPPVF